MPDGTSVGVISLDLVIKEKLGDQLNSIKSNISKSLSGSTDSAVKSVTDGLRKLTADENKVIAEAMSKYRAEQEKWKNSIERSFDFDLPDTSAAAEQAIEPLNKSLEKLKEEAREALSGAMYEVDSDPVGRMRQEVENATEKLSLMQAKWQQLQSDLISADGEEAASKIGESLNTVERNIINLTDRIDKLKSKIAESSAELPEPDLTKFSEKMKTGFSEIWEGCKQTTKAAATEIGSYLLAPFKGIKNTIVAPFVAAKEKIVNVFSGLKYYLEHPLQGFSALASSTFGKFGKTASKAFKSFKNVAGKAVDSIRSKFSRLHGSVGGMSKPLSKFGNTLKNAAKRIFIMAGVLAVFKAMRSALTEAANGNEEFAKSLNEVKANIGVAFQPIINAVMPALNSLMAALAKATKYVAAFISELFGTTYQKSLESVKQVKAVAKEADKASTHLAAFDEMNVISSSGSSSSSSEDSGGVDYSALDGSDVKLPDWAQRMKDAISGGDWAGVGSLLAEKVNGALNSIDWDALKKKVVGAVGSITDALNGFFGKLDWSALGKDIGESINTVFLALDTFFTGFDFKGFGTGVATTLNNAIKTTDWKLIGKTLADKWNALIDGLYGFVTTFDWSGFGDSLAESVNSWFDTINWAELGQTLSESVKGVLDTIIHFIEGVDWKGVGEKLWTFIKNIDWGGIAARIAEAFGAAIGAAASLIWGFIKEAWGKVVKWWKDTAFKDGKFTITGLLEGIWEKIKGIGSWIKQKIFDPFIKGFKKAFGIASPSKEMSEQGGFIMEGLKNGVVEKIGALIQKFKDILAKIKGVFKDIGSWFSEKFSAAWQGVKDAFVSVGEFFKGIWKSIVTPFLKASEWFKNQFKRAWQAIKDVFSSVGEFFGGIWETIKQKFSSIGTKVAEAIGGAFKTAINAVITVVEGAINLIPKAINGALDLINKIIPGDGIDPMPTISLPRLAKGGLATAPTLAMVGDNKNARTDPEVIAPLSKLSSMLGTGNNSEIIELLRQILALLRGGQHIDLYLKGRRETRLIAQEVIDEINDIINTTGTIPIMI